MTPQPNPYPPEAMKPANPENVPLDKIPAGWRLLCEEEYGNEKLVPTRQWLFSSEKFSALCYPTESRRPKYTYITPDLPDNGQPWHAHKPGDPAPVGSKVKVDLVVLNGWIYTDQYTDWSCSDSSQDFNILFYRLHDPATKPNPQTTFEAHGHTWFKHTPGDPMPCDGEAEVSVILDSEMKGVIDFEEEVSKAKCWHWGRSPTWKIVGWRYAHRERYAPPTPIAEPTVKPHNPHLSDRILDLLIIAGHVTPEKVEQARKLAQP